MPDQPARRQVRETAQLYDLRAMGINTLDQLATFKARYGDRPLSDRMLASLARAEEQLQS